MRPIVSVRFLSIALVSLGAMTACSGAAPVGEDEDRTAEGLTLDDGSPKPPPPPRPPPPLRAYPSLACPPGQFLPLIVNGSTLTCTVNTTGACSWTAPPAVCWNSVALPPAGVPSIMGLALGAHTTYALAESNELNAAVYSWGLNADYELGNGTTTNAEDPVLTEWISGVPVTAIAAGDNDGCALMGDGTVRCWGTIATLPSAVVAKTPVEIALPQGTVVTQIAHGQNHACARTTTGAVYCWGNNDKQQLGDATNSAGRIAPYKVPTVAGEGAIVAIAAGGRSTCALNSAGTAWCWGDNERGSLGNSRGIIAPAPGSAASYTATPQQVVEASAGGGLLGAFTVPSSGNPNPTFVGGGAGTFCAQVGEAAEYGWYCWGANDQGQAGAAINGQSLTIDLIAPTPTESGVSQAPVFAVGLNHSCVGGTSGGSSWALHCFGANNDGQLGDNTTTSALSPQNVDSVQLTSYAVTFTSFAVGANHSCATGRYATSATTTSPLSDFACWGNNDSGQTGVLSTTSTFNLGLWSTIPNSPLEPSPMSW